MSSPCKEWDRNCLQAFNARRRRKSLSFVRFESVIVHIYFTLLKMHFIHKFCLLHVLALYMYCILQLLLLHLVVAVMVFQGAAFWHSPVRHKTRKLMRAVSPKQITNALQAGALWDLGFSGAIFSHFTQAFSEKMNSVGVYKVHTLIITLLMQAPVSKLQYSTRDWL